MVDNSNKSPNNSDLESLLQSIRQSDTNAVLLLEMLSEAYDLKDIAQSKGQSSGGLGPYLTAVLCGAEKTAGYFLKNGAAGPQTRSDFPRNGLAIFSQSLKSYVFVDGANDVCWSIFSKDKDALKKLERLYRQEGLELDINSRTAVTAAAAQLSNSAAKQITPLDLAVQFYIAMKIAEQEKVRAGKVYAEKLALRAQKTINAMGDAGQAFSGSIKVMPSPHMRHIYDLDAPKIEAKIMHLLQLGAKGSDAAYFPSAVTSLSAPIMNSDGLEIMSLKEFCENNADYLTPDLFSALTNTQQAPKPDISL